LLAAHQNVKISIHILINKYQRDKIEGLLLMKNTLRFLKIGVRMGRILTSFLGGTNLEGFDRLPISIG
jgi:hypothetical protein